MYSMFILYMFYSWYVFFTEGVFACFEKVACIFIFFHRDTAQLPSAPTWGVEGNCSTGSGLRDVYMCSFSLNQQVTAFKNTSFFNASWLFLPELYFLKCLKVHYTSL